ncbi:hypothetical protein ERO13_D06G090960v2 [Gossypium hirsutum]|nr:hypothetical protein ERO13_D06G090960v2 [Gossypium hirsutum]
MNSVWLLTFLSRRIWLNMQRAACTVQNTEPTVRNLKLE